MTIESVSAIRAQLWDAGFRPVPIVNHDALGPSPGKRPLGNDWRQEALKDPPFCVTVPPVAHALNSGILCDGLRAIDIDIDDTAMATRIRAMALDRFGETSIRMRRNSPRCLLLYRAAQGAPTKIAIAGTDRQKVEVLGAGQQFVAFGRHDSGADLEWFPEAPGEISADQLPAIDETAVLEFLTAVAPMIGADPPGRANGHDHYSPSEPQADPLRVAAAVARIPNAGPSDWEAWNRIGMAIWAATGGSAIGGELFNEWSKRHPAYDPTETEARWLHYRRSPPTSIGAGTLFHLGGRGEPQLGATIADPPAWLDEAPPPDCEPDGMSAAEWREVEARESGHAIPSSPEARADAGKSIWSIVDPWEEIDIPVRPWLARGYLMRRSVTVISGPGSAGKSSLMVAWATAMAVGSAFGRFKIAERLRVATYNVEDDADEQRRRFSAMFRKMGLTTEAMRGYLAILGPERVGTLLTTARDGSLLVNTPVMDRLDAFISEFRPNVLILDPFVELHQAEENDNTAVRAVMARFRSMAIEYDMSVVILHHARKGAGTPGDPDSLRGASSIVGAARVTLTLNVMTEEEAEAFNVPADERRDYFRLDGAKNNYAPIESAEWFERQVVTLHNGGAGTEPDGVAVAWPWKPRTVLAQVNPVDLNRALDIIATPGAGWLWMSDPRSSHWAGTPVMEATGCSEKQAANIIKTWLKSKLLYKEDFHDEAQRKMRPGLRVDISKRPTE